MTLPMLVEQDATDAGDAAVLATYAEAINAEHRLASAAIRQAVEHARRAGELLLEARAMFPYGTWLPWLKVHCDVSVRTAQIYMRVAGSWQALQDDPEYAAAAHSGDLPLRKVLAILTERTEREPAPLDLNIPTEFRCPFCSFAWSGNPKPPLAEPEQDAPATSTVQSRDAELTEPARSNLRGERAQRERTGLTATMATAGDVGLTGR